MKRIVLIMSIACLAVFAHCNDECICDAGPFYSDLRIKLSLDQDNPEVFLTVFAGKIEQGDTLFTEYVSESTVYYEMEAGHYYSAITSYTRGGRTYVAVDGRKMNTTTDDCGCEYGEEATLNLRLVD